MPAKRDSWEQPGTIIYKEAAKFDQEEKDTDVYVLRQKKIISVTPLNLDMTARVKFSDLDKFLRE